MRLRDKVAIVTGGANGIGRATALLFAREGAKVVIADRDRAAGETCASAIAAEGGEAIFVQVDVSSDTDVETLIRKTVERYGTLHVLVNSAGIAIQGAVVDTEPARWQRTLDVDLAGIYRTCRFAIPHMVRQGGGSIVNVASLQGMYGWPRYAAYAASKAGILGLTRQIAVEYAEQGIRANAISPGAIETRLGENSARLEPAFAGDPGASSSPAEVGSSSSPPTQRPRLRGPGRPEDVAFAALFLACDEAGHISGHNLVVDGGASARIA
jgi:NAD(P)-dependent dehydrogenase (short-subunit alcohol dehydrogenase family)